MQTNQSSNFAYLCRLHKFCDVLIVLLGEEAFPKGVKMKRIGSYRNKYGNSFLKELTLTEGSVPVKKGYRQNRDNFPYSSIET